MGCAKAADARFGQVSRRNLLGGTLSKEIMPDFLHLSAKGYDIWGAAVQEKLAEMLK